MRSEVLKIIVFQDVTPVWYVCSSIMLVSTHQTTQCHISEYYNFKDVNASKIMVFRVRITCSFIGGFEHFRGT
jgi:hypothetical protein